MTPIAASPPGGSLLEQTRGIARHIQVRDAIPLERVAADRPVLEVVLVVGEVLGNADRAHLPEERERDDCEDGDDPERRPDKAAACLPLLPVDGARFNDVLEHAVTAPRPGCVRRHCQNLPRATLAASSTCGSSVRSRTEDAHDLLEHRLAAAASIEAALVVASERVRYRVDQAAIAERARPVRQIAAGCPDLRQVVVRDERARDGHAVAVAFDDRLADQRRVLVAAGVDAWESTRPP